jgi:Protein of unknown function (DUF4238)
LDQHTITRWLLSDFARPAPGGLEISVFDKTRGETSGEPPSTFMVKVDDHSPEIEARLAKIESRAAVAARRLARRVAELPPGLCRIDEDRDIATDAPLRGFVGRAAGFDIYRVDRQIARPSAEDQAAISEFMGLMYTRAPKIEAVMRAHAAAFIRGVKDAVRVMGQPPSAANEAWLTEQEEHGRWRGLENARNLGEVLRARQWWAVRCGPNEQFVLGDSPVVVSIALGHDDGWRPLFAPEAYVVAMPLSPDVALVVTPVVIPGIGNPHAVLSWINRLTWHWAERYVAGQTVEAIEVSAGNLTADERRQTITAGADVEASRLQGIGTVCRAQANAPWPRWIRCRLSFRIDVTK